ncbi:MAG: DeoR/GlpR family DNA-binding transcription regulator [Armatimonadota bacterium]
MGIRTTKILELVTNNQEVTVRELADMFGVAEMTIRRDFDKLQKQGLLTRTHGGALSSPRLRFLQVGMQNGMPSKFKTKLGKLAASLVQPEQTVMVDTGTTALEVARHLPQDKGITVVTTSLCVAQELFETNIEVFLIGGFLRKSFPSVYGPATEKFLNDLRIDVLFIGCDGAHSDDGYYSNDLHISSLEQAMIRIADKVVVVTESTKFGRRAVARYATIQDVDLLVTDDRISPIDKTRLEQQGVTLMIAENE